MKKLNYLFVAALLVMFAACEKNEVVEKLPEQVKETRSVYVDHGMLVFDSQESFDATLEKVEKMSSDERLNWENNLGFKSFNRLGQEILNNEAEYTEYYENMPENELKKYIESGEYQNYSPMAQKYIQKGIIKKVINDKGEEYMDLINLLYPMLINEEGFVAVGNEIRQYTENQYKVLKGLNYNKTKVLKSYNTQIDNELVFVSDLILKDRKKSLGVAIDYTAESYTVDRQRIRIHEYATTYAKYPKNYESYFNISLNNEKKNIWGNFKPQSVPTWYSGYFYVTTGWHSSVPPYTDIIMTTKYYDFGESDINISSTGPRVYSYSWYASTLKDYMIPTFPTPSWYQASRWGGPSGIIVAIQDHQNGLRSF